MVIERDSDGDGYSDNTEKDAGSDPTNPNSTPEDLDGDGIKNDEDKNPNIIRRQMIIKRCHLDK